MSPDPCLIFANRSELDRAVASQLLELVHQTLAERGTCSLALAGGGTPRGAYELLAERRVEWEGVEFFWGDERSVPPEHPASNYRMAMESFLSRVNVRPAAIHRILGEAGSPTAAALYATELRRCLGQPIPRLDLILLGIGSDGHTASLFPDTPNILGESELAVATTSPIPPRDRVSLTLRTINAARHVMFIVAGGEKASILARIFEARRGQTDRALPASLVRPMDGTLTWMLDHDAASQIREST
jgi:6-phosphogluconolactonase